MDVRERLLTAATESSKHDQVLCTGKEQAAVARYPHTEKHIINLTRYLSISPCPSIDGWIDRQTDRYNYYRYIDRSIHPSVYLAAEGTVGQ